MTILRSVLAVIVGYLLFALPALAYFRLSGQAPHQAAPPLTMLGSVVVGVSAALLGGYVAAVTAGRRPLWHGALVAAVLAAGAIASLLATLGHGAIWSQVSALLLMAPAAVLGAWLRKRQLAGS